MKNNQLQNKYNEILLFIIFMLYLHSFSYSQVDSSFKKTGLSYSSYIKMVADSNLDYCAEKYNTNIAEAKISASKVFQDPSIEIDWAQDKEGNAISGYGLTAEFTKTINLAQKRNARIKLAKSESQITIALLEDYFRNLRADATLTYLSALKKENLYKVSLNSYLTMRKLAEADSIKLSLGSIMVIDASQSKIEAGILLNDLLQIDAERKSSFLALSTLTSSFHADTLFYPIGNFQKPNRNFSLKELINSALNNRADLLAAKNNVDYSQKFFILTKRERMADIDLKAGTSNSYLKTINSDPSSSEIYAGITIPLKLSNLNKGEIKIAKYQLEQSNLKLQQLEISIQNEVIKNYNQYISLYLQVNNFDNGLLEQAKTVLNGKIYSYSRGETSLLEVLNAQRTYNDLQMSYYETLYNCYSALIELERSVGIWDINF